MNPLDQLDLKQINYRQKIMNNALDIALLAH
jgi:hypothetical protein